MLQVLQPASNLPLYSTPLGIPPPPGVYPGPGQATLLRPGQYIYVLNNTSIGAGGSSIAVQLERTKSGFYYPIGFSVEISGGTATLQLSDTDADQFYCTSPATPTAPNGSGVSRFEVTNYWALFARLNFAAAGTVTAKFTR